jgi:molybdopterin-guanine dinucleotide biosynthesis protein A
MHNTNFSAALLAGGLSRRMKRDKAALEIDGEPLWQRQLHTLQQLQPAELLISGHADGPYAGGGVPVVTDRPGQLGPLGGLAALLHQNAHPLIVVLGVDLPQVHASFLQTLLERSLAEQKALVTHDGTRFQPLAAIYSRTCLPLLEQCLGERDRSFQHFIRQGVEQGLIATRLLESEELPLFLNLNTPEDLEAASL